MTRHMTSDYEKTRLYHSEYMFACTVRYVRDLLVYEEVSFVLVMST